jgi:hypothetical protein
VPRWGRPHAQNGPEFLRHFYGEPPVLTRFLRPRAQIAGMTAAIFIFAWLAYVALLWAFLIYQGRK